MRSNLLIDIGRCKQLVDLEVRKARLEDELKGIKREIEALWSPILLDITRAGVKSIPLKSGARLQPYRTLFCNKASGIPTELATDALKRAGLAYMVGESYAPGKLKEWLREKDEELKKAHTPPNDINDLLPQVLRKFFTVTEKNSVTVVGAKAILKEEDNGEESE
jgi:hypothetical protein